MKKKSLISIILVAAMALSMVGCGGGAEETTAAATEAATEAAAEEAAEEVTEAVAEATGGAEGLDIGVSFVSLSFPYYVRMYEKTKALCDEKGWNMTFVDGNLDASTQLNGIQDMINAGVDAVVVSTWYIDAMVDVFQQCKDAGIAVIVDGQTEIKPEQNGLVDFVCGTEHYDAGYLGGVWAGKHFSEEGVTEINMVIMSGSTEQMRDRGQGFIDGMADNGVTANVYNWYEVEAREDGMTSAEDAITAYPDLELIYGVSAQGALGAYDATVGANRTDIYVIGYDGEDEEIERIDEGNNYIATVTQNPEGEAESMINAIEKIFNGEEYETVELIPAGIYCADGQLTSEEVLGE